MGKVEDMRRQREAQHGVVAPEGEGADATEARCPVCRKVKGVQNGVMVSHQKGLGTMCPGSRKPPT